MPTSPLSITLFGSVAVSVRGAPPRPLSSRPAEWLLALLVLRHGRPVARAALAGTLWPESRHEQALLNLRRVLLELRRALGPEAARLSSPTRDSLWLDLTGAAVDLLAFDAAVAAGAEAALQEAVPLYRGELLEGCSEEWIFGEREARREAGLRALEKLADLALARGAAAAALGHLNRAETLDPLRDSVQQRRMQALAASGDLPAALLSYREYRLRLHREMNLEPDPETTRLFRELQAGRGGEGARGRGGEREHKPKVEHAHEHDGDRTGSPPRSLTFSPPHPLTPSPPRPLPIPRPLTALIGREAELGEVTGLVTASRLVTLIGGGGVGKTRLALQVAAGLAPQFPERVLFVELAPLADPALLPASVAAAVGLHEAGETPGAGSLVQTLAAWLAPQPALLVLDNCEHLIQAVAELAQRLLAACPDLHLLATSRQRLGVTGEIAWRVPSLSAPDPERLPGDTAGAVEYALQFPAVQLFLERAAAVRPGFRLRDREEAVALARLCQRLDGIPLALELAAARVAMLNVSQIAARLDDRFRLLASGSRAAIPRHQTLRALIDWSYDSLPAEEAALLRRLSVFAGGWTLEAAEAVCGGEGGRGKGVGRGVDADSPSLPPTPFTLHPDVVLDRLTVLMDRSLVLVEEPGAREASGEPLRYRMLETVREYAREKLQQCSEEAAARAGHRAYFLHLAEEAGPNLRGPSPEAALAQLGAEIDNFRAALAWCQEGADSAGAGAAAALRLVDASWWLWHPQGRLAEGLHWLAGALERGRQLPPAARAPALFRAAHLCGAQGDRDRARSFFQAARCEYEAFLAEVRREGNAGAVAGVLLTLSEVAFALDDLDAAAAFGVQARQSFEARQEPAGVARSLEWLAAVALRRQDRQTARVLLEERVALCRKVGVPDLLIHALGALGHLEREEGHHGRAGTLYRESLRLRQEAGALFALAQSLEDLAGLAGREQQFDRAVRLLGASEVFCESLGARPPVALVPEYERTVAESRAALGAAAFAAAWAEGRAMSLDQAVEYASAGQEAAGGEGAAQAGGATPVGTASDPPLAPSSSPPVAPSRLPRPLTALVGREEELPEVMGLVGACRLVTLIGGGGVGKTRLALQVAAGLAPQFPERVLFVELAPLTDPTLLPGVVAGALGLHEDAGREPHHLLQWLVGWLAEEPTLLVLDNCEHLVQAVAELARSLLSACPALHLLATSRQRLGVTGETAWRVPSLPAPDPEQLPADGPGAIDHVRQFPAAQLFLERAAAVRAGFRLRDREEALAVARLCQRLDGIPLALELAAARVTVLDVSRIAARLDDRFCLLTGGSRAAGPRHQTLRALIDWSYDSLPAEEAALLRRLSVFAGGWTLEAAEAVCGGEGSRVWGVGCRADADSPFLHPTPHTLLPSPVLDRLAALEERSLVLVEELPQGLRYRMLETVREYAHEKLREGGEEATVRDAHAAYFLTLAEAAAAGIHGPEQGQWLSRLEAEHGNLRAALAWCLEAVDSGQCLVVSAGKGTGSGATAFDGTGLTTIHQPPTTAVEVGLRLASAMVYFWGRAYHWDEGRRYLEALLASPPAAGRTAARAAALDAAGSLAAIRLDYGAVRAYAGECLALCEELGDRRGMARALSCLSRRIDPLEEMRRLAERSLALFRECNDPAGAASALIRLAELARSALEYDAARTFQREALEIARSVGDRVLEAECLVELGSIEFLDRSDDAATEGYYRDSLALARELGWQGQVALSLYHLGRLAFRQRDYPAARVLWEECLELYRRQSRKGGMVVSALAELAAVQGDYPAARALWEESLADGRELGWPDHAALALRGLADTARLAGDFAGALMRYRECLQVVRAMADHPDRKSSDWWRNALYAQCLCGMAAVLSQSGREEPATRLLGAAEALPQSRRAQPSSITQAADPQLIAALRRALGEEAFAAAWAEGGAMPPDRAVEYAVEDGIV